jgi:ribonuclease III
MNKLITTAQVESLLNLLGNIGDGGTYLHINNLSPYQTAFVHRSYFTHPDPNVPYAPSSDNEVLEYLGDSCINFVVARYLVERFDQQHEGFLTTVRALLVRTDSLHRFSMFLGLGDYLLLSPALESGGTHTHVARARSNPRFHEDCFEAFVGAIIVDFGDEQGYRYARRFLVNIIEDQVDFAPLIMNNTNYKDVCQRYYQSMRWPTPVYVDLEQPGPSYQKTFLKSLFLREEQLATFPEKVRDRVHNFHRQCVDGMAASIAQRIGQQGELLVGYGTGNKKGTAEQNCAKMTLLNLGIPLNWTP